MTKYIEPEADLDSLDCIFGHDENMFGGSLKHIHMFEVIVIRLQREARGLPLDTVQQLLLERLASTYVTVKWRETLDKEEGGFKHASEAKDVNSFLMSLFQEWNRVMKGTDIEQRQLLTRELLEEVTRTLRKVEIPSANKSLLVTALEEDLVKAGWTTGE